MRLNSIKSARGSKTTGKRIGRGIGSGKGKTAGRGHKGQKSRSGGRIRPGFEGGQQPIQLRLPKFGFNSAMARVTAEIRLSELEKVDAEVIDLKALKDANVISDNMKRARVMLSGNLSKAVTLKGIGVTRGARSAIEAAGGSIQDQ
ncbi:MAG: 50S ribosomal protein L15 [Gammaproteobacteria bacterium]|nr:50S ribosomal protein L15 [Gammaproteobacteria bacterium]